ncbi:MFS general substrate transporter [Dothidotthia symphoricarpi CBS 119687]|uniref:MFS general substrate transporter n=1 Tax=Dothidotthia symphoricarpi CBS 119687 TaxID=1392245 RepID=A0A6A6AGF9_9PLEO|nr:MFS general substrate transporter [Dothidotthia symphoricarpi CBS 119687]KAF2131009.1 MFS general substrate transporter [Dothidotthia symphoricarpi CBS 119687]
MSTKVVSIFSSLESFTCGYNFGFIGGSVASPFFTSYFNKPNPNQVGVVVPLFTGGGLFGALLAGPSADWLGRRLAIIVGAVTFILGGLFQAVTQNISFLYSGRAIVGFGVGYLVMIIPLCQTEIARSSIRGRVTGLRQLMLGMIPLENQRRIPLKIQLIPADEGLKKPARLISNGSVNDAWVQEEYSQIEQAISTEHEQTAKGYKDLFTDKSSFRQIYRVLNTGTGDALIYQGISNMLSVLAQACTVALIDRIGRRWPLIIGNMFKGICWIVVVIAIALFPTAIPFTCRLLSWSTPAEVFDTKTRSKGISNCGMVPFAFNTFVSQPTPITMASVGWRFFLTFVICNFTNALFFWATLPETARRPLEEMNSLFSENVWFVAGDRGRVRLSNDTNVERVLGDEAAHSRTEQLE